MSEPDTALGGARRAAATTTAAPGCAESVAAVEADPAAVRTRFPMAGRKTGRGPLLLDADPDDVHAWTVDDAVAHAAARRARRPRRGRARRALPLRRRGRAARPAARAPVPAGRRPRRVARRRRDPDERHAARRRGARPVRDRAPRRRRLRPGGAQVRLHRRPDRAARRAARRARRRRPRGCSPRSCTSASPPGRDIPAEVWDRDRPPSAGRRAGRDRGGAREPRSPTAARRPSGRWRITTREEFHEDLRAARAHDVAHHRRLRGDGRVGGEGARRAGVLARPAAHVGRVVHRLLQLAARLGALPRRAVRDPPPLHDRPQPEGGQRRRAAARGARAAAALPREGRRRRGGRDRLRRDDAGGGRGAARAVRPRARVRAARARPHAAPRQGGRDAQDARSWSRRPASRPRPS